VLLAVVDDAVIGYGGTVEFVEATST